MKADVGIIGLAVMGENIALNLEDKGYTVALYNRIITGETSLVEQFMNGRGKNKKFLGTRSIEQFVDNINRPRRIMLMVNAGAPVEELILQLLPLLSAGDVIIDGANSYYKDTERRVKLLEDNWMYFIGAGLAGGESGALNGLSVMPGGSVLAWPMVKPLMESIAARLDDDSPCCEWMGPGGAGHFVMMIHNGIEYCYMQLIAEAFSLLKCRKGIDNDGLSVVFDEWNMDELHSYLIHITANIFRRKDKDNNWIVDKILDVAGQKGTGKWSAMASFEETDPFTVLTEAVYARMVSVMHDERLAASEWYDEPVRLNKELFIEEIRQALYSSLVVAFAQGFSLLYKASKHHCWNLDLAGVARIWQKGSIIRGSLLERITSAFEHNPCLENLLFDEFFHVKLLNAAPSWRKAVAEGILGGIPLPSMASALSYFDGIRTLHSPANLIQAQRDYFGAHMYERIDHDRGEFFHTNWSSGADTTIADANTENQ